MSSSGDPCRDDGDRPQSQSYAATQYNQATAAEIKARYERAQYLEQGSLTKRVFFNTTLYPHWIGESDSFWYKRDSKTAYDYRIVDAKNGTQQAAFDHQTLARALANAAGKKVDAHNLPMADIEISLSPLQVSFSAFDKHWRYDQRSKRCVEQTAYPKDWRLSPDGSKALFARDNNLWIRDVKTEKEYALTNDGEAFYVFGSTPTAYGRQEAITLEAIWSPDSKRVFTQVIDTRKVKIGPPLVDHVPDDGSLRPQIIHPERRLAFPRDKEIEGYQFLAIDVATRRIQWADYPLCPIFKPAYIGYFTGHRGWWGGDSRHAYFIDLERGGKTGRLLKFDTTTGKTTTIIEERDSYYVKFIPVSHLTALIRPLPETNEVIWYSERSGWAHLYLHDLKTGRLKKTITEGEWVVRNVLHYDPARRELFIQTAGRDKAHNPHYCDICRVNIDTGQLTPVINTDHEYVVCDQRSRISFRDRAATGVSPSGRYVVTTRSRVDQVPVSLLLDRNGNRVSTVETANVSGLPKGWQWPEPVMVKSADDSTDIYAVVFKPSNFSPRETYPIIDFTLEYSAPAGSFTNTHVGALFSYMPPAALAELGFIVVLVASRGSDLRDKTFNNAKDALVPNRHYNQADCVAAITQLAETRPYMDLNRVGVGVSSIALSGLFSHPDFYQVGVAAFPDGDDRLTGAFHRIEEDTPHLSTHAEKLQGKLLLIHGMMDDVIPVASTFRLIEALKKANKRFDAILLPDLGHGLTGYETQRIWDYFIQHLRNEVPPEDFKLTLGYELYLEALAKKSDAS